MDKDKLNNRLDEHKQTELDTGRVAVYFNLINKTATPVIESLWDFNKRTERIERKGCTVYDRGIFIVNGELFPTMHIIKATQIPKLYAHIKKKTK